MFRINVVGGINLMVDTFGKSCKRGVLNERVGGNFLGNLISVVHQINMLFLRIICH